MLKTELNSTKITRKNTWKLKGVTSLTVANYGVTVANLTIGNVTRQIQPYDTDAEFARNWSMDGDGTQVDLEISIDFVGGSGEVILDYRQLKENQC